MISGFRIEATIEPNKHDVRTSKELMEYTAGDIADKGVTWMTTNSPNADALTRKGDTFDLAFNNKGKKQISMSIKETQMRVASWKEKQYIETFSLRWIESGKTWDEFWRLLIFHHVTVKRVKYNDQSASGGISWYDVVMQVEAGVEYMKSDGSAPS